ncbi:MAG: uracil phosphoribosyltransferase [Bacteroidales bacterium]|nr:uracil phosphoribosyltransferase [Candidatus Physcousia equi]
MKTINLSLQSTLVNQFVAELRHVDVQTDRMRFRQNLRRLGQCMAYEIARTFDYSEKSVTTPLGVAQALTPDNDVVVGTVFRAGLPMHEGMLDMLDGAGNAFVSAYRYYKDEKCSEVEVCIEYLASPCLDGRTLIIADPMLATGESMELALKAFCTKGTPSTVHLACIIASEQGVAHLQKVFAQRDDITLWCAVVDPLLNEHKYIVPGLGDAGDLAYGGKD